MITQPPGEASARADAATEEIAERDTAIESMRGEITALKRELVRANEGLATRHTTAEDLSAEIKAMDTELAALRAEVQELRVVAAGSRAEAAAQRTAFARARQKAAERDRTLETMRGEVAERDTTIERMRGEITSLIARPPSETLLKTRQIGTTIDQLFEKLRSVFKSQSITLADRASAAGEWAVAAHYYRIALDRNPNRSEIWIQYGHVLKEADRLSSAEQAYREAIAAAPTRAEPYRYLGDVLSAQRRRDDAVAAYLHAHSLDPTSPHAVSGLKKLGWSENEPVAVEGVSQRTN